METLVDTVAKWLADYLVLTGEPVDSAIIRVNFKRDFLGISERTLQRAKTKIGIRIIRKSGKDHGTLWALPNNFNLTEFQQELKTLLIPEKPKQQVSQMISQLIRKEIVQRYGGKCALCGNPHLDFLELDHVRGDGAQHRKECKGEVYRAVLVEDYRPDKYRILCKICNWLARWLTDDEILAWWKPLRFPENNMAIDR